jgi:N-formylglutamate amidohydrolase
MGIKGFRLGPVSRYRTANAEAEDRVTRLPFTLARPVAQSTSAIFAAPHSGRDYSHAFLASASLDERAIRSSEDAFVDLLFDMAPDYGAPFLVAGAPRAFVDLNRAADELDPALIDGVRRGAHSPRIASGLGVIPRVVANGRPIYRGKLTLEEAQNRIARWWRPYHDTLRSLVDETLSTFGEAILIDCHSMPHEALESLGTGTNRPDVVLGDRFGAAAASHVVDRIEYAFRGAGLRVARNMPFAGAYVTQHYGRPSCRCHAVQVEIDRALYMNETSIEPSADFHAFRALITGVVSAIADIGRPEDIRVAAE